MDDTLTDRVLTRLQELHPELNSTRNPRELIRTELGYVDAHIYDPESPSSGRILATSLERRGNTHVTSFDPTDAAQMDEAIKNAVAYLRAPHETG